jgi:serine/threonine protein kinase/tetratricopeptide (TPR) repeat protein
MPLTSGSRLGPYEVIAPIGAGGMGEVYRARDTRLNRIVALKILPADVGRDPERLARFDREARLASSLNHANIVVIYDIGQDVGIHYIAMEYVEGEMLLDAIRRGPPPVAVTADLAAQIADALARAHAAGVIHRDLKPSNIMVTPDRRAKVLDFGLGKFIERGATSNALTELRRGETTPGVLLGTAAYMSPEQGVGGISDARSDQFALGLILYEMLSGAHPFARASGVQTLSAIIEEEPEPLGARAPKTPEALAHIVERCLAKNPAERFDSTADLARALQSICDHLRSGRTLAPVPRIRKRRPPAWAWPTAALALAIGALALWPPTSPDTTPLPGARQVALLPFNNIGDDPANQALADGLGEVLTTRLTQLERFSGGLQVVPAVEVRQQRIASAADARRAFGVNVVVSGSVQRAGHHLLLTLNVIDGASRRQIRADTLDLTQQDAAALQDEVLIRLARLLDIDMNQQALALVSAGGTRAPDAYQYYLQGRGYLQQRRYADAARAFERASELDPKNYQVWFNLASAYLWSPGSEDKVRAAFERTVTLGEEARTVNARDALLLGKLANCYAQLGDAAKARALAGEAEALASKDASVFLLSAQAYEQIGDRTQALSKVAAAVERGMSREDIEANRSLDELRADPAYVRRPTP